MNRTLPNRDARGYAAHALLRAVLLAAVLGQIVYLAGRPEARVRADLTEEKLYTLSESTRNVLRGLESTVFVEAYFSSAELLPSVLGEYRTGLENLLDEYAQISNGRVRVQYFDPHDDVEIEKKAERLGIRPQSVQDADARTYSLSEIYQGFRLLYGADKQKVIPFLGFTNELWQYESVLTPIIKELAVLEKPKIGVLASQTEAGGGNPMFGQQRTQPQGYHRFREVGKERYDLQNVDLSDGKLVPEDLVGLLVIRPKNLTDRQKYAIDQYLMRGGKLVVFADTAEYMPGADRSFQATEVSFDDPASKHKFVDLLGHYGVDVQPDKVVADFLQDAWVPLAIPVQQYWGQSAMQLFYPYWLRALDVEWAKPEIVSVVAKQTLSNPQLSNGSNQKELEEQLTAMLKPGMEKENNLLKGFRQAPGFFWPCQLAIADPLPANVKGGFLLRTSPFGYAEPAPPALDPFMSARSAQDRMQNHQVFAQQLQQKFASHERRQFGLLAHLEGEFASFFEGKEIPPAKPPVAEEEKPKDPLSGDVQETPIETEKGEKVEPTDPPAETEQPELAGPPAPDAPEPEAKKDDEPAPIFKSKPAQLLVVADADFLRDDVIGGEHAQAGGPADPAPAYQFAMALLDWIGEESDLIALRNRTPVDRRLNFGDMAMTARESVGKMGQEIKRTETTAKVFNIALPPLLLALVWIIVAARRIHQKQVFLTKTGA